MRDIYDEFAKEHADGEVEFKAIPTEDIDSVVENKVAGGSYPDMVDLAGRSVSLGAISQDLLLDMKPYIDEEGIKDNVGINYTQNDVDGKIYTVHDQLLTLGYWYNAVSYTHLARKSSPPVWRICMQSKNGWNLVLRNRQSGDQTDGNGCKTDFDRGVCI